MLNNALANLADIALCASNDFHLMHLNYTGAEFDSMHKKVLRKYYEEAAADYDTFAEAARLLDPAREIESPNNAAVRAKWESLNGFYDRVTAVEWTDKLLAVYLEALLVVWAALDEQRDCYKCVGIANTVQTRIEYWSKEKDYFNAGRV